MITFVKEYTTEDIISLLKSEIEKKFPTTIKLATGQAKLDIINPDLFRLKLEVND